RSALGLGDLIYTQIDRAGEERNYRAALALAQEGAKANPGNPDWRRALSIAHCRIGGMLFRQKPRALPAVPESYQACLAIAEPLAGADPGNTDLQQDLAWAHSNVGDVQREQGDRAGALTSYRAALAIAERNRDDSKWWGQLGMLHSDVSWMQEEQGDL